VTTITKRARGRPRNRDADRAILDSALGLLSQHGYARMSVDSVAEHAGVGKSTIYRRHASKEELVAAALVRLAAPEQLPDTGSTRRDLVEVLRQTQAQFQAGPGMQIVGAVLAEERDNPHLLKLLRRRVILPRRQALRRVLERGVERGEVRRQVDLDAAIDALLGAQFARYVAGLPQSHASVEPIVNAVWQGLTSR
jgi:AcrR family transcriptional regulator